MSSESDLYENRYIQGISKIYEKVLILEKIEVDKNNGRGYGSRDGLKQTRGVAGGTRVNPPSTRRCYKFGTVKGCSFGSNCRFQHVYRNGHKACNNCSSKPNYDDHSDINCRIRICSKCGDKHHEKRCPTHATCSICSQKGHDTSIHGHF